MRRSRPILALLAAALVAGCATTSSTVRSRAPAPDDLDPDVVALFVESQLILNEAPPAEGPDTRAARAAALLEEAVAREPDSSFLRRYLAEAWSSQRDLAKSIAAAQAALRLDPTDARTHYILGRDYLGNGDLELAEGHFREAARRGIGGDTPWLPHRSLFTVLRTLGRVDEAVVALDEWMAALPQHAEPATIKATYLWESGRLEEAVDAALVALRVDPGSDRALAIVETWFRHDPVGEAEALEAVLATNWSDERLHRRLVDVYDVMGRYDKALAHLRYVGMLDYRAEGELVRQRATLLRDSHRHGEAEALLLARLEAAGEAAEPLDLLHLASVRESARDWDGALAALADVSPERDEYAAAARSRVRVLASAGRLDDAVEAAYASRQVVPRDRPSSQAGILRAAAEALIEAERWDPAARLVADVVALQPDSGRLLEIRLQAAQGDVDGADATLEELLLRAPDDLSLVFLRSEILADAGRHEAAAAALDDGIVFIETRAAREALITGERGGPAWEIANEADHDVAWLLLRRSFVEKSGGDVAAAEATLVRVLDRWPHHPDALNALGYLLAEEGRDLDRPHALLVRALEQRPFSGAYEDSMGWVLYRQGKPKEALERLERAAEWLPGEPEIEAHLREVHEALD